MPDAVTPLERDHLESCTLSSDRAEVLARYRRLREISQRHNSAMQRVISQEAVLQHARQLGLARGRTFFLDSMDELSYAFDLAIHTAPAGRSRAIDRYAESARAVPASDEMLMLNAMRAAHFSLLRVERRHEVAGLVATDLCRRVERWLIDVGLESSIPDGSTMATRLYTPERFSMTAGVNVPLDDLTMMTLIAELPQHMRQAARGDRR
jgi:hypothetical protein